MRIHGRGFPKGIIQWEEENLKVAQAMRGSTKAVHLTSSMKCPDLLAVCLNDTKPVYLLSMMATGVRLIMKEWGVWSTKVQKKAMINYLCLNVIEECNKIMNLMDIADHLHGSYQQSH